jgi:DNA-binding ferritin-like protein
MDTTDLSDATLDCWVERAELLRLNPNSSVADVAGVSHCQKFTADVNLARPIIEREKIKVEQVGDPFRGTIFLAYRPDAATTSILDAGRMWPEDTELDAAMVCYVVAVFGDEVEGKMLWDDGTVRHPYELD